uniref:PHD-type domain-containing protein n=1 Tax=Timema cristinae TaxID=61476 RepID=A0A7R9GY59_TIMCR|nr:unnamed protein product [Timema cristinae]
MASDKEVSCICDPNFAVICSFLEKFAASCGINHPNFLELQEMLENSQEVPQPLMDLHIKLLRKSRKNVSQDRWEKALIKFCHTYSNQDGWEIERFGYKKARLTVKLRVLKMLLEQQFDSNSKFKSEVNKLSAEELRIPPLGRDKLGQTYWCQLDDDCSLRVYREDLDEETWDVVAKNREGLVKLMSQLSSNDPLNDELDPVLNEDSNSLEIEKPITDTGQADEFIDGELKNLTGGMDGAGSTMEERGESEEEERSKEEAIKNKPNKLPPVQSDPKSGSRKIMEQEEAIEFEAPFDSNKSQEASAFNLNGNTVTGKQPKRKGKTKKSFKKLTSKDFPGHISANQPTTVSASTTPPVKVDPKLPIDIETDIVTQNAAILISPNKLASKLSSLTEESRHTSEKLEPTLHTEDKTIKLLSENSDPIHPRDKIINEVLPEKVKSLLLPEKTNSSLPLGKTNTPIETTNSTTLYQKSNSTCPPNEKDLKVPSKKDDSVQPPQPLDNTDISLDKAECLSLGKKTILFTSDETDDGSSEKVKLISPTEKSIPKMPTVKNDSKLFIEKEPLLTTTQIETPKIPIGKEDANPNSDNLSDTVQGNKESAQVQSTTNDLKNEAPTLSSKLSNISAVKEGVLSKDQKVPINSEEKLKHSEHKPNKSELLNQESSKTNNKLDKNGSLEVVSPPLQSTSDGDATKALVDKNSLIDDKLEAALREMEGGKSPGEINILPTEPSIGSGVTIAAMLAEGLGSKFDFVNTEVKVVRKSSKIAEKDKSIEVLSTHLKTKVMEDGVAAGIINPSSKKETKHLHERLSSQGTYNSWDPKPESKVGGKTNIGSWDMSQTGKVQDVRFDLRSEPVKGFGIMNPKEAGIDLSSLKTSTSLGERKTPSLDLSRVKVGVMGMDLSAKKSPEIIPLVSNMSKKSELKVTHELTGSAGVCDLSTKKSPDKITHPPNFDPAQAYNFGSKMGLGMGVLPLSMATDLSTRKMAFNITEYMNTRLDSRTLGGLTQIEKLTLLSQSIKPNEERKTFLPGDDISRGVKRDSREAGVSDSWTNKMARYVEPSENRGSGSLLPPNLEVGEAIEEPLMLVRGEGSGRECDTGNPAKDTQNSTKKAKDADDTQNNRTQKVKDADDTKNNSKTLTGNSSSLGNSNENISIGSKSESEKQSINAPNQETVESSKALANIESFGVVSSLEIKQKNITESSIHGEEKLDKSVPNEFVQNEKTPIEMSKTQSMPVQKGIPNICTLVTSAENLTEVDKKIESHGKIENEAPNINSPPIRLNRLMSNNPRESTSYGMSRTTGIEADSTSQVYASASRRKNDEKKGEDLTKAFNPSKAGEPLGSLKQLRQSSPDAIQYGHAEDLTSSNKLGINLIEQSKSAGSFKPKLFRPHALDFGPKKHVESVELSSSVTSVSLCDTSKLLDIPRYSSGITNPKDESPKAFCTPEISISAPKTEAYEKLKSSSHSESLSTISERDQSSKKLPVQTSSPKNSEAPLPITKLELTKSPNTFSEESFTSKKPVVAPLFCNPIVEQMLMPSRECTISSSSELHKDQSLSQQPLTNVSKLSKSPEPPHVSGTLLANFSVDLLKPSEAPLPVTKRFLQSVSKSPTNLEESDKVSPTKTPPKLWSIEAICASDDKTKGVADKSGASSSPLISSSVIDSSAPTLAKQEKMCKWSLGIQVIKKSQQDEGSPTIKKTSRWDVGKPTLASVTQTSTQAAEKLSSSSTIQTLSSDIHVPVSSSSDKEITNKISSASYVDWSSKHTTSSSKTRPCSSLQNKGDTLNKYENVSSSVSEPLLSISSEHSSTTKNGAKLTIKNLKPEVKTSNISAEKNPSSKIDNISVVTKPSSRIDNASVETKPSSRIDNVSVETKPSSRIDNVSVERKPYSRIDTASVETKPSSRIDTVVETKPSSRIDNVIETKSSSKIDNVVETKSSSRIDNISVETKPSSRLDNISVETKSSSRIDNVRVETKPSSRIDNVVETKPSSRIDNVSVETKPSSRIDSAIVEIKHPSRIDNVNVTNSSSGKSKIGPSSEILSFSIANMVDKTFNSEKNKCDHIGEKSKGFSIQDLCGISLPEKDVLISKSTDKSDKHRTKPSDTGASAEVCCDSSGDTKVLNTDKMIGGEKEVMSQFVVDSSISLRDGLMKAIAGQDNKEPPDKTNESKVVPASAISANIPTQKHISENVSSNNSFIPKRSTDVFSSQPSALIEEDSAITNTSKQIPKNASFDQTSSVSGSDESKMQVTPETCENAKSKLSSKLDENQFSKSEKVSDEKVAAKLEKPKEPEKPVSTSTITTGINITETESNKIEKPNLVKSFPTSSKRHIKETNVLSNTLPNNLLPSHHSAENSKFLKTFSETSTILNTREGPKVDSTVSSSVPQSKLSQVSSGSGKRRKSVESISMGIMMGKLTGKAGLALQSKILEIPLSGTQLLDKVLDIDSRKIGMLEETPGLKLPELPKSLPTLKSSPESTSTNVASPESLASLLIGKSKDKENCMKSLSSKDEGKLFDEKLECVLLDESLPTEKSPNDKVGRHELAVKPFNTTKDDIKHDSSTSVELPSKKIDFSKPDTSLFVENKDDTKTSSPQAIEKQEQPIDITKPLEGIKIIKSNVLSQPEKLAAGSDKKEVCKSPTVEKILEKKSFDNNSPTTLLEVDSDSAIISSNFEKTSKIDSTSLSNSKTEFCIKVLDTKISVPSIDKPLAPSTQKIGKVDETCVTPTIVVKSLEKADEINILESNITTDKTVDKPVSSSVLAKSEEQDDTKTSVSPSKPIKDDEISSICTISPSSEKSPIMPTCAQILLPTKDDAKQIDTVVTSSVVKSLKDIDNKPSIELSKIADSKNEASVTLNIAEDEIKVVGVVSSDSAIKEPVKTGTEPNNLPLSSTSPGEEKTPIKSPEEPKKIFLKLKPQSELLMPGKEPLIPPPVNKDSKTPSPEKLSPIGRLKIIPEASITSFMKFSTPLRDTDASRGVGSFHLSREQQPMVMAVQGLNCPSVDKPTTVQGISKLPKQKGELISSPAELKGLRQTASPPEKSGRPTNIVLTRVQAQLAEKLRGPPSVGETKALSKKLEIKKNKGKAPLSKTEKVEAIKTVDLETTDSKGTENKDKEGLEERPEVAKRNLRGKIKSIQEPSTKHVLKKAVSKMGIEPLKENKNLVEESPNKSMKECKEKNKDDLDGKSDSENTALRKEQQSPELVLKTTTIQNLSLDYIPPPVELTRTRNSFPPRGNKAKAATRKGRTKSGEIKPPREIPKKEEVKTPDDHLVVESCGDLSPQRVTRAKRYKTTPEVKVSPEIKATEVVPEKKTPVKGKAKVSKVVENENTPTRRKRRNSRRTHSGSEGEWKEEGGGDAGRKRESNDAEVDVGGKRRKMKGKRTPDLELRRTIEEQKCLEGGDSSSDEDRFDVPEHFGGMSMEEDSSSVPVVITGEKKRGKPVSRGRGRARGKGKGRGTIPSSKTAAESPAPSSDVPSDSSKPSPKKNKGSRILKGLDMGAELLTDDTGAGPSSGTPVRQSRRIAQIKIKEEAERRELEEMTLYSYHEEQRKKRNKKQSKHENSNEAKLPKSDQKKKKLQVESDEDYIQLGQEEPLISKIKRKKRKKKSGISKFNELNPWMSSSGSSSSSQEEVEEDEEEELEPTEDESNLVFKSDHEFSPESDLEGEEGDIQLPRRARTAQKESDGELAEVDDHACQKCGKMDHPEWILLCDKCDNGWHGSCLRPALLVIPEGDWFCPPCEHNAGGLCEYDRCSKRRENEELRRKRLAYVGISLDNVLPNKDKEEESAAESTQGSADKRSSSSSQSGHSSGDESEPVYQLRERRQALFSYRFNEYDDLINSAIQDELEAVKGAGNQGRGKDIANIVNAEKDELASGEKEKEGQEKEGQVEEEEEDEEEAPGYIPPVKPKYISLGKKKHRRLNSLDISSEDDAESDEDFKGTSSEEDEEEDEEPLDSDDSELGRRRSRRSNQPVRRSSRARTTRFDREFINDETDSDYAPKRKKTRRLFVESDSEESDDWNRSKRRKSSGHKLGLSHKSKSKKKKKKESVDDESGAESAKEKKPRKRKVKFGGLDSLDDVPIMPRTRGRKMNYQEMAGSDSEEVGEILKAMQKKLETEDEEFLASKENFDDEDGVKEDDKEAAEEEDDPEDEAVVQSAAIKKGKQERKPKQKKKGVRKPREKKPKAEKKLQRVKTIRVKRPLTPVESEEYDEEEEEEDLMPMTEEEREMMEMEAEAEEEERLMMEEELAREEGLMALEDEEEEEEEVEEELTAEEAQMMVMLEAERVKKAAKEEKKRLKKEQKKLEKKEQKKRGKLARKLEEAQAAAEATAVAMSSVGLGGINRPAEGGVPAQGSGPIPPNLPTQSHVTPPLSYPHLMGPQHPMVPEMVQPPMPAPLDHKLEEGEIPIGAMALDAISPTKPKRRGRGRGKATIAAAAAAAAAAAENSVGGKMVERFPPSPQGFVPQQPPQPGGSVITRMLQAQPAVSTQSFTAAAAAMGHKYFGSPTLGSEQPPARGVGPMPQVASQYQIPPRGRIPSPYRQTGPPPPLTSSPSGSPSMPPHYGRAPMGQMPPMRMRTAGLNNAPPPPQMYHTSHHPLDPSPSGGGPIAIASTTPGGGSSPLHQSPTPTGSPLSGKPGQNTPPPPPYARGPGLPSMSSVPGPAIPPPLIRYPADVGPPLSNGSRHPSQVNQFAPSGAPGHLQQPQPSPPQHPGRNAYPPYHPPPSYHYGAYPPPPPLTTADDAMPPTVYQGSPYPDHFSTLDASSNLQPSDNSNSKSYDEEGGGEFGGLVSYFSSQREDDLDT